MNIERKKIAVLLATVAVAAIMGGIALSAYATNNGEQNSTEFPSWINEGIITRANEPSHGQLRVPRCFGFIDVSEEFENNVINIAESDQDVQDLLNDGYNITRVRPIIKTVVEADGSVVTKATSASVMLEKDITSHASVWVDLEEAKVTEIVILTRAVIEKP